MTDSNGFNTTMLMTPANGVPFMGGYGNNGGLFGNGDSWLGILFLIALCNGGFGFGNGDWAWIILLLLLGWGNNGFGGYGGGGRYGIIEIKDGKIDAKLEQYEH